MKCDNINQMITLTVITKSGLNHITFFNYSSSKPTSLKHSCSKINNYNYTTLQQVQAVHTMTVQNMTVQNMTVQNMTVQNMTVQNRTVQNMTF